MNQTPGRILRFNAADGTVGHTVRALAERGMPIEEGTLYPLLRRLEDQKLLTSEWRIEDGPPAVITF